MWLHTINAFYYCVSWLNTPFNIPYGSRGQISSFASLKTIDRYWQRYNILRNCTNCFVCRFPLQICNYHCWLTYGHDNYGNIARFAQLKIRTKFHAMNSLNFKRFFRWEMSQIFGKDAQFFCVFNGEEEAISIQYNLIHSMVWLMLWIHDESDAEAAKTSFWT